MAAPPWYSAMRVSPDVMQIGRAHHGEDGGAGFLGCRRRFVLVFGLFVLGLFILDLSSLDLSINWLTTLPCASKICAARSMSMRSASTRLAPCHTTALPS